jgi:hypothetical protein
MPSFVKVGRQGRLHRKLFKGQFAKTRLCAAFEVGTCNQGENCTFAHGSGELSILPDLRKTSFCSKFQAGFCPHSMADCGFAHGVEDLRTSNATAPISSSRLPTFDSFTRATTCESDDSPCRGTRLLSLDSSLGGDSPCRSYLRSPSEISSEDRWSDSCPLLELDDSRSTEPDATVSRRMSAFDEAQARNQLLARQLMDMFRQVSNSNAKQVEELLVEAMPVCYFD